MIKDDFYEEFCSYMGIEKYLELQSIEKLIEVADYDFQCDTGIDIENLSSYYEDFLIYKNQKQKNVDIKNITVIGGFDKSNNREDVSIDLTRGDIISIVGPTGSGKSRLLEDIEWIAQGDTPTGRKVLINHEVPSEEIRFSIDTKLVAQLSQNMNFIMDTTVEEFIELHAQSREVKNIELIIEKIIKESNKLAGEKFTRKTPVTALSGGQSRALMIADTAFLSNSPIVLIDEIENAGIDRRKAIELLVKNEKIVIMATHDPILALIAHRRIVIKNGGIYKVIETTQEEKENLTELEIMDKKLLEIRNRLRLGEIVKI